MKIPMLKVIFNVTETCQNGNERRVQKAVYMHRFYEENGKRLFMGRETQIERGTAALKEEHYYNIEYGSTVATEIIIA